MRQHTISFRLSHISRKSERKTRVRDSEILPFMVAMANDAHTMLEDWGSCAQEAFKSEHRPKFQNFPGAGPLEFVSIDILVPLREVTSDNQHMATMTDRYSTLSYAISTGKITSIHLATMLSDSWILSNCIPHHVWANNGPQFDSKSFTTLCLFVGVNKLATSTYVPLENGQAQRYKCALPARLHQYISEHQRYLETNYTHSNMCKIRSRVEIQQRPHSM